MNEPARATTLAELLAHPQVWRADAVTPAADGAAVSRPLPTGFPSLDAKLAEKGWPRAGLVEVICAETGMGELSLLAPAFGALEREAGRWVVWIDPPFIPYAPALAGLGLDLSRILLIRTLTHASVSDKRASHRDAVWSAELALKSGACGAVLSWYDETLLKPRDVRRLKLAARRGSALGVLFRPTSQHASMADLRIQLDCDAGSGRLELTVLKQRGGWPTGKLSLEPPPLAHSHRAFADALTRWRTMRCVPAYGDGFVVPISPDPQSPRPGRGARALVDAARIFE